MSINLKLIDRAPALASHPHVFVILGGDAVATIDYSINPAQRTATAVTDRHFGVQFEADRTSVSSGGSVADVMSKINPGFVRFPGGYHTESRFDITQPNGPGLREGLTGFLNNAAASGQKTIMVLPTHCFFDGNGLRPGAEEAVRNFVTSLLSGGYGPADNQACSAQVDQTLDTLKGAQMAWPMAYALAWISVSGGESVMPPWVRASFPQAALIVRQLRDTNCGKPGCAWCATMNDPKGALKKWFGFPAYRPEPSDSEGRPLQEVIVEKTMAHSNVLGILPTGTGKSVCYQVPALSLYDKTGALTVVISPLVALMADQVQGMERTGISSAVTINGMLSMPERQEALDRVRLGQAAILLISPEQLRSVSVRSVLKQREVGFWVLDEAHCVSKWGHDFRPDYRYVSRFIRESSGDAPPAPVLCLTATAKPEVVRDVTDHFRERLGVELALFDGGASRANLRFSVQATRRETKPNDTRAT